MLNWIKRAWHASALTAKQTFKPREPQERPASLITQATSDHVLRHLTDLEIKHGNDHSRQVAEGHIDAGNRYFDNDVVLSRAFFQSTEAKL